ncbi:MAG TPA: hypothetical protein H9694_02860 [Firmicutes bacterium]|nr:hypothetical protein [Bacillota bacterium]
MPLCKRCLAPFAAACLLLAGCHKQEENNFGMDVNQMNPLVMYATDEETGETVFSRDPSIISSVTTLFESMKRTQAADSDGTGITFAMSTMYGDFLFGECWDNRLRLNGQEYTLDRDNEETIRLLYGRLVSETANTGEVETENILDVTPDMTYRELLDSFGPTLETAVTGPEKAYLYQYRGKPFYILFKSETDTVGMTGEQLMEELSYNYNLSQTLSEPLPQEGGRLAVYQQAFSRLLEKAEPRPSVLWLDTERLIHLNDGEQAALAEYLESTYSLEVRDSHTAAVYLSGNRALEPDEAAAGIAWYSYIGSERMVFSAVLRQGEEEPATEEREWVLRDGEWKG